MTVLEMGELRRILVFFILISSGEVSFRGSHLKRKERKGGNEKESIFRNTGKEGVISGCAAESALSCDFQKRTV